MESKTNYTVVGFIVLVLALGLLIGSIWLSTGFDKKKYDIYTVYMQEPVSGLSKEAPVKYNGVKVGYINKISLNPKNPQQVKLQIEVEAGTPITISTHASLINQGITGNTYIGLSATSPTFIPLQKTRGEEYPVIPYKSSFLNQLEKTLDDIGTKVNQVFNPENTKNIQKTLAHLEAITATIANNRNNIQKTLHELPEVIHGIQNGINKFDDMAKNMSMAGKQVSTTMQNGRNSIQKITQQAIPPAVVLLQKLNSIANNLEILSAQMRQNPSVVFRGNSPPTPGPGE